MAKQRRRTEKSKPNYPVKDATRDLVINVTANDIKKAKPEDSYSCAAAHALCRNPKYKRAKVTKDTTYVQLANGSFVRYLTPQDLYIELIVYDRGGRMEAKQYKLLAPTGSKRLGHHVKPKGKGGGTGKLPRIIHNIEHVRPNAPKGYGALKALMEGR